MCEFNISNDGQLLKTCIIKKVFLLTLFQNMHVCRFYLNVRLALIIGPFRSLDLIFYVWTRKRTIIISLSNSVDLSQIICTLSGETFSWYALFNIIQETCYLYRQLQFVISRVMLIIRGCFYLFCLLLLFFSVSVCSYNDLQIFYGFFFLFGFLNSQNITMILIMVILASISAEKFEQ